MKQLTLPDQKISTTAQVVTGCDSVQEPVRMVAEWAMSHGLSTGHGETIADLLEEIGWQVKEMKTENARFHDELDRLLNIETAARQWWKAKGRYNSQIAACKVGEALNLPVQWPKCYIPANSDSATKKL